MSMSLGKAEINVTPLIDVLLVLIIIFMVVLPEHSAGLPAVLPQPAPPDANPPDETSVVVSVNQDHSISINQPAVPIEKLQERLRAIFATRATRVIFVRGFRGLEFQDIARVIDIAKGADVFQIGLMTE
jgi:biopolymer transport protein TolR